MRNLAFVILILFISYSANSQCTEGFFPFQKGTEIENSTYDASKKYQGKIITRVISSTASKITVDSEIFDEKNKSIGNSTYEIICSDGAIKLDFNKLLPTGLISQIEGASVTYEGDDLEFPHDLTEGKVLPEGKGKMTLTMAKEGVDMSMVINLRFYNRKVSAKETVVTQAGSFTTFKITNDVESISEIMGMKQAFNYKSATWLSKGVGMVKTESYDEKGKLSGYTILTSLKKP